MLESVVARPRAVWQTESQQRVVVCKGAHEDTGSQQSSKRDGASACRARRNSDVPPTIPKPCCNEQSIETSPLAAIVRESPAPSGVLVRCETGRERVGAIGQSPISPRNRSA